MATATRGRPRDGHIDDAVLGAVDALLDSGGVEQVSIGEVARRAEVSRPAIYRRWPDGERLLLAALARRMLAVDVPGTDCTLCDLHEVIVLTSRVYRSMGASTVAALLARGAGSAELREELTATLLAPVRDVVRRTLDAAAGRGDLRSGLDLDLFVDTLCALTFHRLLLGEAPLDGREVEGVVVGMLRGIAADPDRLLADYADAGPHDHG